MDLADGGNEIDMKRKWNWPIWVGFIITVGGLFSYEFFAQFSVTRDFPWANLLLFAAGGFFLVLGLFRAFGKPQLYRGKIVAVRARPEQVLKAFDETGGRTAH